MMREDAQGGGAQKLHGVALAREARALIAINRLGPLVVT